MREEDEKGRKIYGEGRNLAVNSIHRKCKKCEKANVRRGKKAKKGS